MAALPLTSSKLSEGQSTATGYFLVANGLWPSPRRRKKDWNPGPNKTRRHATERPLTWGCSFQLSIFFVTLAQQNMFSISVFSNHQDPKKRIPMSSNTRCLCLSPCAGCWPGEWIGDLRCALRLLPCGREQQEPWLSPFNSQIRNGWLSSWKVLTYIFVLSEQKHEEKTLYQRCLSCHSIFQTSYEHTCSLNNSASRCLLRKRGLGMAAEDLSPAIPEQKRPRTDSWLPPACGDQAIKSLSHQLKWLSFFCFL